MLPAIILFTIFIFIGLMYHLYLIVKKDYDYEAIDFVALLCDIIGDILALAFLWGVCYGN